MYNMLFYPDPHFQTHPNTYGRLDFYIIYPYIHIYIFPLNPMKSYEIPILSWSNHPSLDLPR